MIHLHPQDGVSMKLWVERLKEDNILIFYKDKLDALPPGLPMHEDDLVLCIQTQYQLDAFQRLGNRFVGIDVTHNTTQYKDIMLYTIITRDDWGHGASGLLPNLIPGIANISATGVPVAWMVSSSMRKDAVAFFLNWVKEASPDVRPSVIMSDRDQAQLTAIQDTYPLSRVFLCTWHVLHTMRRHFVTDAFKPLWDKIQIWVKTGDSAKFSRIWDEISTNPLAPKSLVEYLKTEWIPVSKM